MREVKPSNLTFDQWGKFKAGDKVRLVGSSPTFGLYKVGRIYTLTTHHTGSLAVDNKYNGLLGEFVLVSADRKGFAKWIKEVEDVNV